MLIAGDWGSSNMRLHLCRVEEGRLIPVETVTREGDASDIITKGRHDPCVGIRGVPVVEAMMALVLADQKLLHRAQCGERPETD